MENERSSSKGLALVTGASTGIGRELARIAAREGYDLVIVANEPEIQTIAEELRARGNDVIAVEADLATFEGVDRFVDAAAGRTIDVVCANAGMSFGGPFLDQEPAKWRPSIDTNITGTLYLLQRTLNQMLSRERGKVLVTGSIAGFMPGPLNAVYNATKAFINNFTEALRSELKHHEGITVTTLMPGATDTDFFMRAGMEDTKLAASAIADPAKVASDGWNAMKEGKGYIISGLAAKVQVAGAEVLPSKVLAEMHHFLAKPV